MKYKTITQKNLKNEPEQIFVHVPLVGAAPDAIVRSQLIGMINTSHVVVVLDNNFWLFNLGHFSILSPSLFDDSRLCGIDVCGKEVNILFVVPFGIHEVVFNLAAFLQLAFCALEEFLVGIFEYRLNFI